MQPLDASENVDPVDLAKLIDANKEFTCFKCRHSSLKIKHDRERNHTGVYYKCNNFSTFVTKRLLAKCALLDKRLI